MQNKLYLFIITVFAILAIGCSSNKKELNQELNKLAVNLNKSAPVMFDINTLFLGAEVTPDNVFQYKYQIVNSTNPAKLVDAMEEQTRANIKEAFLMNPDLQIFTANNVSIDYVYTDSLGKIIKTIHIKPEDYK